MRFKNLLHKMLTRLHWPHVITLIFAILLLVISGFLSLKLYDSSGAWSALFASISAGCVTGIIFYLLVNLRDNEMRNNKEEFEAIEKNYNILRETTLLCSECLEKEDLHQTHIPQIIENVNALISYMSTLIFASPKVVKHIKDFPPDYLEAIKKAEMSLTILEDSIVLNNGQDINGTAKPNVINIISFCSKTKSIVFNPMIELMLEYHELNNSVL